MLGCLHASRRPFLFLIVLLDCFLNLYLISLSFLPFILRDYYICWGFKVLFTWMGWLLVC